MARALREATLQEVAAREGAARAPPVITVVPGGHDAASHDAASREAGAQDAAPPPSPSSRDDDDDNGPIPLSLYRLSKIRSLPGNDACVKCDRTRYPDWASITYGTLLCINSEPLASR
ncbi:hypothetical protein ACHAW5_008265 [Stephanodiscus triporus]|uniref:Uncharacterized protein n=1 Tax=Stephanodiscus triporus TaxID=2934178 RepID=A0ABD3Q5Z6_9STRA